MIKLYATFFVTLLFCSSLLLGQEEDAPTTPPVAIKKPVIQSIEEQDDIWSLEFGTLFWNNKAKEFNPSRFSFELGLNYHFELNLGQRHAFSFGAGYRFLRLNHSGTFSNKEHLGTVYTPTKETDELSYSRLHLNQLHFPLELRLKFTNKFKVYLGYESYITMKAINRSEINDEEKTFRDFKTLNAFQHGPKLRVGISDLFLYVSYNAAGVFSQEIGATNYFSFGVSIGG
jgi:hypothetical protein